MSSTDPDVPTEFLKDTGVSKVKIARPRRRSIVREYCSNASAHGLPGIARSNSIQSCVVRSVTFIVFIAVMIFFLVKAIIAYFNYPTNMDISYISEWPQYFPAFSLCNASPLRMDRFQGPFLNFTSMHNLTNANDTIFSKFQLQTIGKFVVDSLNKNKSVESYFYSLPSMLHYCTFNNVPCSASDFILFTSFTHGACYTYNARLKNMTSRRLLYANEYGSDGKLSLGLYVHGHQYVPNIQDGE